MFVQGWTKCMLIVVPDNLWYYSIAKHFFLNPCLCDSVTFSVSQNFCVKTLYVILEHIYVWIQSHLSDTCDTVLCSHLSDHVKPCNVVSHRSDTVSSFWTSKWHCHVFQHLNDTVSYFPTSKWHCHVFQQLNDTVSGFKLSEGHVMFLVI